MIKQEGHFGHIRDLGDDLFELKFNDGRRIYYTIIPVNNVILLLGGGKKIVTSAKQKTVYKRQKKMQKKELTLKDFEGIGKEHNPSDYLTNPENIGRAIVECLENNDPEGVMEVISLYLEAVNKTKLAKSTDLHRQTVYSALKHKNPTVKTLAKLMYSYAH